MTVHIGNLSDNNLLEFSNPSCTSCSQMCRQSKSISVELPASELPELPDAGRVKIGINARLQMKILMNSIVLPLLGFVSGALVSDYAQLNDFGALVLSLVGLIAGILMCRRFSFSHLQISEPSVSERQTISQR